MNKYIGNAIMKLGIRFKGGKDMNYALWLLANYIMAFVITFFIIKNIVLNFSGGKFLLKIVMAGLYVVAIIIVSHAAKFAHMASLYPQQYAGAGFSSKEIVVRDIGAIGLIIVSHFIKRIIDRGVEKKVRENQNDQRTQKWNSFLKK